MIILPEWVLLATSIAVFGALPAMFVTGMSVIADAVKTPRQEVLLFLSCWMGFSLLIWLAFLIREHVTFA